MRALRPHYESEESFVDRVDEVQRSEGYRLVGVFEDETQHAVAVAGFRVGHMLAWGRYLYVDDLSTLPEARRRGHGRQLLEWLTEEARRLGCEQLHLDSGVGPDRIDAHRLYFNAGLAISSYHFARRLQP
jgi:GNAT superfamily N-acetyltransferase